MRPCGWFKLVSSSFQSLHGCWKMSLGITVHVRLHIHRYSSRPETGKFWDLCSCEKLKSSKKCEYESCLRRDILLKGLGNWGSLSTLCNAFRLWQFLRRRRRLLLRLSWVELPEFGHQPVYLISGVLQRAAWVYMQKIAELSWGTSQLVRSDH